jgi:hypothetical protein
MKLIEYLRGRMWIPVAGYLFYVAALTAGYYNLTFVQLGLVDLGTRLVGMSRRDVSVVMAVLALVTLAVAISTGVLMDRRRWSVNLPVKIRILLAVCRRGRGRTRVLRGRALPIRVAYRGVQPGRGGCDDRGVVPPA